MGVQQAASDYGEEVEVAHQIGCASTGWTRDITECSGIPGVNERLAVNHGQTVRLRSTSRSSAQSTQHTTTSALAASGLACSPHFESGTSCMTGLLVGH